MKKSLRTTLLLLALMASSVSFAQTTVTFTAGTDKGADGGTAATEVTLTKDGITLKASGATYKDAPSNSGVFGRTDNYRIYKGATLTVSSTVGNITKVVFTCTSSNPASNFTDASTGTYDGTTGTWTGDAASFSLVASVAQVRATKIEVTYGSGGTTPVTPDPVTPTVTTAADIAAFKALAKGTDATLTLNNAQVVYTWTSNNNNNSTYVRDASGALLFYNSGLDLKAGDVLNGTVSLTRSEYNNSAQAAKNDATSAANLTITAGADPEPEDIGYADAKNYVSDLVIIKNVDIVKDGRNFYIGTGDDRLQVYNGFHLDGYTVAEAKGVAVKGIVTLYKSTYEIQPIEDPATTTASVKAISTTDDASAPAYNLGGQRVSNAYKGIVVKKGKKFIRK